VTGRRAWFNISGRERIVRIARPEVSSASGTAPFDSSGLVLAPDALRFAREMLDFEPDDRQSQLLEKPIHRLLLNCTRQWGKSTITAIVALHRAWTTPDSLILAVSGSQRQSSEFLRKVSGFLRRLGEKARGDGTNRSSLVLPNGSRIVALPEVEETLRGFSAVSLLIVDEAAVVRDDVYRALRPMLSTSDGDLWLLSTPRGKSGFFWNEWSSGGPEWMRVSVKAEDCPRISTSFLEEERRSKGEMHFRREYCCEFVQPENAVFREEDIAACLYDDEPLFSELITVPSHSRTSSSDADLPDLSGAGGRR